MLEGIRQELDIAGLRGLVDTKKDEDELLDFFARFVDEEGYVKVTRCRDCRYWNPLETAGQDGTCQLDIAEYSCSCNYLDTHFCAHGEPKEGE